MKRGVLPCKSKTGVAAGRVAQGSSPTYCLKHLWNSRFRQRLAYLSSCRYEHSKRYSKYDFEMSEDLRVAKLRPLRTRQTCTERCLLSVCYGKAGFAETAPGFEGLRTWLTETAQAVDAGYPANGQVVLNEAGEPVLKRGPPRVAQHLRLGKDFAERPHVQRAHVKPTCGNARCHHRL